MASIRRRDGARGTSYAVLAVDGGTQRSQTFDNEKAAIKFQKLVEALGWKGALEVHKGSSVGKATVDALAREWLDWKRRDLTTEGHRDYVRRYERWIKPTLGQRVADQLDERDVQRWVDDVLAPNLGGKTVADMHALLHGLYAWSSARSRGYVTHNPCKETDLPRRKKAPVRGLTLPELHSLLDAGERLARHDPGFRDAADVIAVMAGTGWRPGEALSPAVQHVETTDAGKVMLTMGQAFRRGEGIVPDGKTESAARTLSVLGPGARALQRRVIGRAWDDLLFPNPNNDRPWNPNAFRRSYWVPIVEEAGLAERAPTPYWLRHTHVLLCIKAKLSLAEIQRRLGHKSIKTTVDVYGRMVDGMSDESEALLEAMLTPGVPAVVEGRIIAGELT